MPEKGEFWPVTDLDYKKLAELGITGPYYVQTDSRMIDINRHIRHYVLKHPEKVEKFEAELRAYGETQPNDQHMDSKLQLRKFLYQTLNTVEHSGLYFCGSTLNRCGNADCDADICWTIPVRITDEGGRVEYPMRDQGVFSTRKHLEKAREDIRSHNMEDHSVSGLKVVEARVKILKFLYRYKDYQAIDVDLNINNVAGIYNTFLLRHYSFIDERFPILARVCKRWATNTEIVAPYRKRLNSYTVTLMVLHYLQCGVHPPILPNLVAMFPKYFSGTMPPEEMIHYYNESFDIQMEPRNPASLTELLIGFLYYYSRFDYFNNAIILREARVDKKETGCNSVFEIEEVYDRFTVPKNLNMGMLRDIRLKFLDAYTSLVTGDLDFSAFHRGVPRFYHSESF